MPSSNSNPSARGWLGRVAALSAVILLMLLGLTLHYSHPRLRAERYVEDHLETLTADAQAALAGEALRYDAAILTAAEYESLVLGRGALVLHEMRTAMGEETFLTALRLFYERGLETDVVGEYDLVSALDDASGGDWEAFLTDWLFNVADYYMESYTLDSIE